MSFDHWAIVCGGIGVSSSEVYGEGRRSPGEGARQLSGDLQAMLSPCGLRRAGPAQQLDGGLVELGTELMPILRAGDITHNDVHTIGAGPNIDRRRGRKAAHASRRTGASPLLLGQPSAIAGFFGHNLPD